MTPLRKETHLSVIICNGKHQTERVLSAFRILETSREVKLKWVEIDIFKWLKNGLNSKVGNGIAAAKNIT